MRPHADLMWIVEAFNVLSPQRPRGVEGPGPIGLPLIMAWCDLHRVPAGDSRVEFAELIGALDVAWFAERKKAKASSGRS